MTTDRPAEYLVSLVRELCKLPRETEWVEFKLNDAEPQERAGKLAAAPPDAQNPFQLLRGEGGRPARGAAGDRAGFPPPGAVPGSRAHPCGFLQEEAEGLSGERAGVVASLRPHTLRGWHCRRAGPGRGSASVAGLPGLLRPAEATASGKPRWNLGGLGGGQLDPSLRGGRLEHHKSRSASLREAAGRLPPAAAQGHEGHSVQRREPRDHSQRTDRRQRLCLRLRGSDQLYRRPLAVQRGDRAGPAQDSADVPGASRTRAGGQCAHPPRFLCHRRRADGRDLR